MSFINRAIVYSVAFAVALFGGLFGGLFGVAAWGTLPPPPKLPDACDDLRADRERLKVVADGWRQVALEQIKGRQECEFQLGCRPPAPVPASIPEPMPAKKAERKIIDPDRRLVDGVWQYDVRCEPPDR